MRGPVARGEISLDSTRLSLSLSLSLSQRSFRSHSFLVPDPRPRRRPTAAETFVWALGDARAVALASRAQLADARALVELAVAQVTNAWRFGGVCYDADRLGVNARRAVCALIRSSRAAAAQGFDWFEWFESDADHPFVDIAEDDGAAAAGAKPWLPTNQADGASRVERWALFVRSSTQFPPSTDVTVRLASSAGALCVPSSADRPSTVVIHVARTGREQTLSARFGRARARNCRRGASRGLSRSRPARRRRVDAVGESDVDARRQRRAGARGLRVDAPAARRRRRRRQQRRLARARRARVGDSRGVARPGERRILGERCGYAAFARNAPSGEPASWPRRTHVTCFSDVCIIRRPAC